MNKTPDWRLKNPSRTHLSAPCDTTTVYPTIESGNLHATIESVNAEKNTRATRATLDKKTGDIAAMFDTVAERYDLMNGILSLGQHIYWRKQAVAAVDAHPGQKVLDVAAGTGVSSEPFADAGIDVIAADLSEGMLDVGRRRRPDMTFVQADVTALPFDDETFDALTRNAERISIISGERIVGELHKIMLTATPSKGFIDLYRCGLLQRIIPELTALDIVETRNGRAHKNNFYHTLEVVDNLAKAQQAAGIIGETQLWLRWAALFHDIGKPRCKRWDNVSGWTFHNHNFVGAKMIPSIFRRMKLPMDSKMKYVQKMVDLHMRPITIANEEVTDSAVRRLLNDAGDDINDLMMLCEADITSKNRVKKQRFLDNFRLVRQKLADLQERDFKRLLQPCIDGNEIMELFHLGPCREVGQLKQTLKDAVLDNQVPNEREPLLALLRKKAAELELI